MTATAERPGFFKRMMGDDPRLEELEAMVEELMEKKKRAVARFRSAEEARDAAIQRATHLAQENAELQDDLDQALSSRKTMAAHQMKLARDQKRSQESLEERARALEVKAIEAERVAEALERQRGEAREEVRALEREIERMKRGRDERLARFEKQLEDAEGAVTQERATAEGLTQEVARLERELEERRDAITVLEDQVEGVDEELVSLQTRHEQLQRERAEEALARDELAERVDTLLAEVKAKGDERDALQARVSELEVAHEEALSRLRDELTLERGGLVDEHREVLAARDAAHEEALDQLRREHEAEVARLRSDVAAARSRAAKLEKGAAKEAEIAEAALKAAEGRCAVLEREREELAALPHWLGRAVEGTFEHCFDRPALAWRILVQHAGPPPIDDLADHLSGTTDDEPWWRDLTS